MKARRHDQNRYGCAKRRWLEFAVVRDQVQRNKARFVARVSARLNPVGGCLCYDGALDHKGYPVMNFRYQGQHVQIGVHRVFAILRNCAPIPQGMEAAHADECQSRRCVLHVSLQHYKDNAATWHKRASQKQSA